MRRQTRLNASLIVGEEHASDGVTRCQHCHRDSTRFVAVAVYLRMGYQGLVLIVCPKCVASFEEPLPEEVIAGARTA